MTLLVAALLAACSTPPGSPTGTGTAGSLPPSAGGSGVPGSPSTSTAPASGSPGPSAATGAGRIVFLRFDAAANHDDIYTVNPDGSDVRPLLPGYAIGFGVPRWSTAGDIVAAQSGERCSTCRPDQDPLGYGFETVIHDAQGDHIHLHLSSDAISVRCAAWSPDDKLLACEGWSDVKKGQEGVYTVSSAAGGDLARLTQAPGGFHDIPGDYAADGRLAFVRTTYSVLGLGEIWIVNADGSNAHKITDTLSTYRISWSPDGRWIVGERDGVLELFDLQDLTADPTRLKLSGGKLSQPRFSPDSRQIVFVFTKTGSSTTAIESMALDGSNVVTITTGQRDSSPDWGAPGF